MQRPAPLPVLPPQLTECLLVAASEGDSEAAEALLQEGAALDARQGGRAAGTEHAAEMCADQP